MEMQDQKTPDHRDDDQAFMAELNEANKKRKLKKRILIVFGCMVAFVLIYMAVAASGILKNLSGNQNPPQNERPATTYSFYEADYDLDILDIDEYMSKDRLIYYCDPNTGVTVSLTDDADRLRYDGAFQTLCTMIDRIIAGNADRYNDLFSSRYYAIEGNERKTEFTMQQVYDIKITWDGKSAQTDENGKTFTQYQYVVEYKIRQNNGTFRDDIDSDASRKQLFILSNAASGASDVFLIDRVVDVPYNY